MPRVIEEDDYLITKENRENGACGIDSINAQARSNSEKKGIHINDYFAGELSSKSDIPETRCFSVIIHFSSSPPISLPSRAAKPRIQRSCRIC